MMTLIDYNNHMCIPNYLIIVQLINSLHVRILRGCDVKNKGLGDCNKFCIQSYRLLFLYFSYTYSYFKFNGVCVACLKTIAEAI